MGRAVIFSEDVGSSPSPRKPSDEDGRREGYPLLVDNQNGLL